MAPPTTMGQRIAWARERAGMNKNQFARELGTSWQHVDHWEKGRTEPSIASIRRIAEILGVSIDFLLGVRSDPTVPSPSGLDRFLAELAPDDITEEETAWLRRAPIDEREASPDDYLALLEGLRRIAHRPPRSGRRRRVDAAAVETAIRRRKGGRA